MKCTQSQLLVGLLVVLTLVGCGKSGEAPAASVTAPTTGANGSPEAAPATQHKGPAPDEVVGAFLESLRNGNVAVAASLITQKAREESQKEGVEVRPFGEPGMKYEIGQTEYVTDAKDGAHVGSVWTLADENGQVENIDVIWVLRLESQGWRIAGMATPGEANQPPNFFNFEDPEVLKALKNDGTEMAENDAIPEGATPAAGLTGNESLAPAPGATPPGFAPPTTLQPRDGGVQNAEVAPGANPLR